VTIEKRTNELEKSQALSEQDINHIKEGMDDIKDLLKEGMDDNRDFFKSINERMVAQEMKNTANEIKNDENEKKITALQSIVVNLEALKNKAIGGWVSAVAGGGVIGFGMNVLWRFMH